MFHRIWDTRKLFGIPDEPTEDGEYDVAMVAKHTESKSGTGTLRAEWRHQKSVSSAYWDPRGRSVVSTSYDDTIRRKLTD